MRILVVEDDPMVAAGLSEGLGRAGFVVDHAAAAEPAESFMTLGHYDAAIVDIGLPGRNGLDLIRRLRRTGLLTPILILTARDALEDRVAGLDVGADDYLVKPFELPELLARLRALIRRSRSVATSELTAGALRLDLARHEASVDAVTLDLTTREWAVLERLVLAMPKVVSKQKLADSLSSWDRELSANAVEIHISRLRAKLEGAGVVIRTVRGIGYRLDEAS